MLKRLLIPERSDVKWIRKFGHTTSSKDPSKLESIDHHLFEHESPIIDEALNEWNTTVPLLEDLTTNTPTATKLQLPNNGI